MDEYRIVAVPIDPTAAAVVLNAQAGQGYSFVAWLRIPDPSAYGQGIFVSTGS